VAPEEFFAGSSVESLRRYLFLGEEYDALTRRFIKKFNRIYALRYVIRSAAQIAFSEGALYRDYLVVLRKQKCLEEDYPFIFVVLKKRVEEIGEKIIQIVQQLKKFEESDADTINTELFEAIKMRRVKHLIRRHIENMKPLVGLNSIRMQKIVHKLLEDLVIKAPTLKDLEESNFLKIRLYRPGQYKIKGTEGVVQRLIIAKYGERSPYLTFRLREENEKEATVIIKAGKKSVQLTIEKDPEIRVLWTQAKVMHMNITAEEEFIVNSNSVLSNEILRSIFGSQNIRGASIDLKTAYESFASNVLLSRRVQLSSPNVYWLAFFSENRTLGIQLPNVILTRENINFSRILVLYLNSSIALLQLLAFVSEVRGAWVSLDHKRVWSHLHVPDLSSIPRQIKEEALRVFEEVGKIKVKPLLERLKLKDTIQKKIDIISLKLLGLNNWIPRLNEIYEALVEELTIMHKILESSQQRKRGIDDKKQKKRKKSEQKTLSDFLNMKTSQ